MPRLTVLSTTAVKASLDMLVPHFERETDHQVVLEFAPSALICNRITQSEPFDLALATKEIISDLIMGGYVKASSEATIAHSGIGMAVQIGASKPDISSTEAFKNALLSAKSIAMSNPAGGGQSGRYLATVFAKLGLTDALKDKLRHGPESPAGLAGRFLVRGEAEIALQQTPELLAVPGIDIVGPLPPDVQATTVFSAGLSSKAINRSGAQELIGFLTTASASAVFGSNGMETK